MSCLTLYNTNFPYTNKLFCEGRWGINNNELGNYLPEWGNSISAWFISILGLLQLYYWDHDSVIIHACSSLFFVNGWASFLTHFTGYVWWNYIDGISMIIVVYLVFGLMVEEFCTEVMNKFIKTKQYILLRTFIWSLLSSIMILNFVFSLESCGENKNFINIQNVFEISFGLPIICTIILVYIQYFIQFDKIKRNKNVKIIWNYLISGTVIAILGTILWILTENLCDSVDFFKKFPGHVIWHIFMSYGLTQILQFIVFVRTNNYKLNCEIINTNKSMLKNIFYFIFPKIVWRDELEIF